MKRTFHRLFWIWDFDKEETWLNEMGAKGYALTGVGLCRYDFDEGEPGEYSYRLECMEHWLNHPESQRYIRFLEETGVEHLGNFRNWAYFRKKKSIGEFELFSDYNLRMKHLRRIRNILIPLLFLAAFWSVYNIVVYCMYGNVISLIGVIYLLLLGVLMAVGEFKICRKISKLKKENLLYEG